MLAGEMVRRVVIAQSEGCSTEWMWFSLSELTVVLYWSEIYEKLVAMSYIYIYIRLLEKCSQADKPQPGTMQTKQKLKISILYTEGK